MNIFSNFGALPGKRLWDRMRTPHHIREAQASRRFQAFTPGKDDGEGGVSVNNNAGRTEAEIEDFLRQIENDKRLFEEQRAKDDALRAAAAAAAEAREKRKNKFFNKLLAWIKDKGLDVVLLPLIPFVGMIRDTLERGGMSGKGTIKEVVTRFYESFVSQYLDKQNAAVTFAAIISAVVAFISNLMKAKKDGEPLTDTEEFIATTAENIENQIDQITEEEIDGAVGRTIRTATGTAKESGLFGILLAVFALYFVGKAMGIGKK